ncbi:proteasome lid subunit RPN8/RPN11 [Deinobacterium chartae]|uniref:Proteasome lid subunit RPN8/RPN11 n=1 Tax=Deinobacterium chartae TaxID=521158 RepID=A0A841HY65_9DEIO|nr:M67 family metallopeptidase [Deinobacterium chartae]MBB6097160.1 proteasome lid subunit RPN8/RPN11 [Deinobacterium chartae]
MGALYLPVSLRVRLWAHAREHAPRECVGLLGGRRGVVSTLYPLRNVADQPERRYLADPEGLVRALMALRREGLELVAIYHSHPLGPDYPSDSDVRYAQYDVPYLIADLSRASLRAFLLPSRLEVNVVEI